MRLKKAGVFLFLAFSFAWTLEFGFFACGGRINSGAFLAIAVLTMFTPALAALVTQKLIWRESLEVFGLVRPRLSWMVVGWLLPVLLVLLALAFSLLVPHISLVTSLDGFYEQLANRLPAAQFSASKAKLAHTPLAIPGALLVVSLWQVLIAGPTINAVAALGEELGWRGFLAHELRDVGFWPASFGTGLAWGLWHLPLIVNGYNYPGHPLIGSAAMTLLCVLLSPLIGYIRLQARSVYAAAVFHGTFNAAATLVLFLRGGDSLAVGVSGVPGLVVLGGANFCLWLHLRRRGARF